MNNDMPLTGRVGGLALAGLGALALSAAPAAAESFSFTVVAGHPPITKGVSGIRDFFIPEVNKRLAETGEHSIEWTEAYAGAVADYRGVLEAVESGIAEFGYVPHLFEGDKLPLEQITYVTPFNSADLQTLMSVIAKLHQEIPEMDAAWKKHNQLVLAPVGIDDYQVVTTFPVNSVADLDGRKISTAGLAVNWLKGTGAIAVKGGLPTFYNAISTGLTEGMLTFESAVAPYKFYEVAPMVTKVGFGAKYASALTVNLDAWNSLPADVQTIMMEVAEEYRTLVADAYASSGATSLETAAANGATVVEMSPEARAEFAGALPNIAREWAASLDAKGLPGTKTLETYMRLSKEAGLEFARDWTAE